MKNPRYAVQVWGANSYTKPYWMSVSYRASLKAAVAEKERWIKSGTNPDHVRIVKI